MVADLREKSRSPRGASSGPEGRENCGSVVPIIDIAALNGHDAQAKARVAEEIGLACETIGFFIVVNHGVPVDIVDAAWAQTSAFFARPLEDKRRYIPEDAAKYPYGYSAFGGENLAVGKRAEKELQVEGEGSKRGDLKEMFQIGPDDARAGMPPRQWPEKSDGLAGAWGAYYEHANKLAQRLLSAFAIALKLPEDWFELKMDRHISALRANNYPDQQGMETAGSIRCSAHTDYGTLTILKSGGPGLQVSKDAVNPVWCDVPYVEHGFVINLGDLMRRWTNDRWSSTLHRVVNPPRGKESEWGRRMSLAFFHNLNKDAVVETIPSCVNEKHAVLYDPIVAGEFLMLKHLASQGKADADAHLKKRVE
eukprot:TRINITY_DN21124_c0_g1_i1.p1 TRINITY_DN21124_c0_g1~~TRINITY_DN21124_c0_g1_i1.p1  ORF type:complete len:366 (+),score=53.77 TRINITY_DN21124_c0_g1_i1:75-1172(+)